LKILELWKSQQVVKEAKSRVFEENSMLVQTDKLARMIESKQDKLRGLQRLTERESIGSIPT
jgi:hypothetical protein